MTPPFCVCGHAVGAHEVQSAEGGVRLAECVCSGVVFGGEVLCVCGRYRAQRDAA